LKRQRSREIITGINVKKAKKILQTYHRIKEWEVNLFICYMKISRQKHVHVCEDMMQLKFMHKILWIRLFFFPPPKSEYFFQPHWESEYFFRKKT
jgi:hypothetical protein